MRELQSKFAAQIWDFIAYRRSFGYKEASYQRLLEFDKFCCSSYPNESAITKELVWGWVKRKPCETHSGQYSRVCVIRLFAKYLNATGIDAYVMPEGLITDRRNFTPYLFTDSELISIFKASDFALAESRHAFVSPSISLIFRLIYACGLRPNEARLLPYTNINLQTGEILIQRTKRNRERVVVMSEEILEVCRKYSSSQKQHGRYFLPNAFGTPFTTLQLRNIFNWCWEKANPGIAPVNMPRARSYDLRHRFASTILLKWLNEGVDLRTMMPYLQIYMGHENLEATAYYVHLLPENLLKNTGIEWDAFSEMIPEVNTWQK